MARKEITVVETYSRKAPTTNPDGSVSTFPPERLNPQPVRHVKGAHGSDEARREAKKKLATLGYKIVYVGFTESSLMVHVDAEMPKQRKPRSATSRLRR